MFEGERPYTNNYRDKAIDNRLIVSNRFLFSSFFASSRFFRVLCCACLQKNTNNFAPSSDLALKPMEGCVFEGERPYTNNERDKAIENGMILSNSFMDFLPFFLE